MGELWHGAQLGPDFECATNGGPGGEDGLIDVLRLEPQFMDKDTDVIEVLSFSNTQDYSVKEVWLTRGQVQDLMVVLGYWLKQTEGEDDAT